MSWEKEERTCQIYDGQGDIVGTFSVYDDDRDLAIFFYGNDKIIGICHRAFSEVEDISGMMPMEEGGLFCRPLNNPPQARLDLGFERVMAELAALGFKVKEEQES